MEIIGFANQNKQKLILIFQQNMRRGLEAYEYLEALPTFNF